MIWPLVLILAPLASGSPAVEAAGVRATGRSVRQDDQLERLLKAARDGRPVIRGQAARRLLRLYEGALAAERERILERLRAEAGEDPAQLALMGSALVEVLAEFGDAGLRASLWAALDDPDFPWRPFAARSLATTVEKTTAEAREQERFHAMLADPIAAVRAAALSGLGALGEEGTGEALRARLMDEDGRVRRTAADLLATRGEARALWWLFEDLLREDRFFDLPTGEQARFQSWTLLAPHLGEEVKAAAAYQPGLAPGAPQGRRALEQIAAALSASDAGPRPELPARLRAASGVPEAFLGLEVRSCRRGEFFLRWTGDGLLLVGQGNAARVSLAPGAAAALGAAMASAADELAGKTLFGQPGCDLEQFLWSPEPGASPTRWLVSKGPDPAAGLRPSALSALAGPMLATLPAAESPDPRLNLLRSRVRAALESVGGNLRQSR